MPSCCYQKNCVYTIRNVASHASFWLSWLLEILLWSEAYKDPLVYHLWTWEDVSSVKLLDPETHIFASTDGIFKIWNLNRTNSNSYVPVLAVWHEWSYQWEGIKYLLNYCFPFFGLLVIQLSSWCIINLTKIFMQISVGLSVYDGYIYVHGIITIPLCFWWLMCGVLLRGLYENEKDSKCNL
jgi:hypothetical protein